MTLSQWLLVILTVQVIHFFGTWKLYIKAGRKSWEAAVPVYNAVVLMKIINRSPWWTILLFVPVIHLIMTPVVWIETLRSFGKNTTKDTLLGLFTLGFYIAWVNYFEEVKYVENRSLKAANKTGDTISSVAYAVVVATLVHTYFMQPFMIPTPSLEKTLLVGDFLFVSKYNYGARVPMTDAAFPMVHDTIPLAGVKSYSKWPQVPYFRFPAFEAVEKNDIVVFNWPTDTVRFFRDQHSVGIRKPIDKKSNYVKRCVGTPGDSLEIKGGDVLINGKKLVLSDRAKPQFYHQVRLKKENPEFLISNKIEGQWRSFTMPRDLWENATVQEYLKRSEIAFEVIDQDAERVFLSGNPNQEVFNKLKMTMTALEFMANMTTEEAEKWKQDAAVASIKRFSWPKSTAVFPQDARYVWSTDDYGPIYIPKKGATVQLDLNSLPFYKEIIREYEKHELKVEGNTILIDGKAATTYTFADDYYWMMGDNRHNSEDSRYWGYVPGTHIVGKPVLIWWSIDPNVPWSKAIDKIRWERLMCTVGGDGEPVSYFPYFVILLTIYFIGNFLYKRKKARA